MFFSLFISCKIIVLSSAISQLLHHIRSFASDMPSWCASALPDNYLSNNCSVLPPCYSVYLRSMAFIVLVLMVSNAFNSGLYSLVFSFQINDLVLASPSNLLLWDSHLGKMLLKKPGQFSALQNRAKGRDLRAMETVPFRPYSLRYYHGACASGCGRRRGGPHCDRKKRTCG